jgi:DNA-binding winged helix-turn-helix (wHTH) protein/TolB-like protein
MRMQFSDFVFDPSTGELWHGGLFVPLQPQPGKVLALLISHAGQVVTRAEIQAHVWGTETHIDFEQGLNWCIRRIREVLGDSPTGSRYIQTIPRRGYRFLAEVRECVPNIPDARPLPWWKARRISAAATFLTLGVFCGAFVSGRSREQAVTVLVLPFDNLSGSQSGPEYGDIASNEFIAALARIDPQKLSVIDPLTARKFKQTKECIIKIGNQLGADYVLLGDVEPSGSVVKVDAQLFKVSTNRQVWATERLIPRNGEPSRVWEEMSGAIGVQLQQSARMKN